MNWTVGRIENLTLQVCADLVGGSNRAISLCPPSAKFHFPLAHSTLPTLLLIDPPWHVYSVASRPFPQ